MLFQRRNLHKREPFRFALSSGVSWLRFVVVVTYVGPKANNMNRDIAHALIEPALLSLLVFPTLAGMLLSEVSAIVSAQSPSMTDTRVLPE